MKRNPELAAVLADAPRGPSLIEKLSTESKKLVATEDPPAVPPVFLRDSPGGFFIRLNTLSLLRTRCSTTSTR